MSNEKKGIESLLEDKDRLYDEAINRLENLVKNYGLSERVLSEFQNNQICFSHPFRVEGVYPSVGLVKNNDRFKKAISEFEEKNERALVYHAIHSDMTFEGIAYETLAILYVSYPDLEDELEVLPEYNQHVLDYWNSFERISEEDDLVYCYVVNFTEEKFSEYGSIRINSLDGSGCIIRVG